MTASEFMREALAEGRLGQGLTSPNPAVGAVIVREGRIVGRGRTQPPGGPHAEVMALRDAGDLARGAAVFVTLEPCSHFGRTPPCTDALIAAGVAEVHFAVSDPYHEVDGNGYRLLRDAGIRVTSGDGAAEAAEDLAGYLKRLDTGMPLVIAKYAASLDGRIAAASGDSRWVSGPVTLAWTHEWRQRLDAVVVGSNTVVVDDPLLTSRPGGGAEPAAPPRHQPLRVVVDSRGRTPAGARVLRGAGEARERGSAPTLVATLESAPAAWRASIERTGAEVLVLPAAPGAGGTAHVDLAALLRVFGERGMLQVLFEGGGVLLGSLFDARLVDRVQAVIAPVVIGAAEAPAAVAGRGAWRMADAPRLRDVQVTRLGEDTLISGTPVWPDHGETAATAGTIAAGKAASGDSRDSGEG